MLFFGISILNADCSIAEETDGVSHKGNSAVHNSEQWINVFFHGTHGSLLSVLSLLKVVQDDCEDTLYRKIQDHVRKNNAFYFNRLMSLPGLHRVPIENLTKKISSVTIPVVQAYDHMVRTTYGSTSNHDYYTFGWNGLLSQKERRLEAIRLYNELSALVHDFAQRGITPKIRLLAHSHGGNVCLNLASIYEVLNGFAHDQASLLKMKTMMHSLDTMKLHVKGDEKQWYQKPTDQDLTIHELVLIATPIQKETESFSFSPFFKKVVNCYSDNDTIQKSDFVSTKERKSKNKISYNGHEKDKNRVKQVRIMVDRVMNDTKTTPIKPNVRKLFDSIKKSLRAKSLSRGGKLVSEHPHDPGHADLVC